MAPLDDGGPSVLGPAIGLPLLCFRPNEDRSLRQPATQIEEAEHARAAATTAVESARASAHVVEREAEIALSRASAARARARVVSAGEVIVSATPDDAPLAIQVPAPVVERMQLDSTAVAALGLLVQRKETVIGAHDRRITADSLELAARAKEFTALERVKDPRCGRKCGIVLGVGGMLAAAVAVEQLRRTFR